MILLLFSTFIMSITTLGCEIDWEKLSQKTPFHKKNVRPQGLARLGDSVFLTNHYKDSDTDKENSDLFEIELKSFSIINKFKFPEGFRHIGGLASDSSNLFAIDFDRQDFLKLDVSSNKEVLKIESLFKIPQRGLSGLALYNGIIAISHYILPHKSPYFSDRYIRFFDLKGGNEISFNGEILSSNYSQGLAFLKNEHGLYLLESINKFKSVLKYWITGLDNEPNIIRIYKINIENKAIKHLADYKSPANMIEDVAVLKNGNILVTDEQNFSFYEGRLFNCL
jgi:hypothetical protein